VLAAGLDQLAALEQVVAERLLDIGVLPGLDRPDARQAVPVVRRRHGDRVDRLVFEKLAEILVVHRLLAGLLLRLVHRRGDDVLIGIADRRDLDVAQFRPATDMDAALPVDADDGDTDALVGARLRPWGAGFGGQARPKRGARGGGGKERLLEEFPAAELGHESPTLRSGVAGNPAPNRPQSPQSKAPRRALWARRP